jgi:nitrate/TMAO reductase-like tetraheme cytochrome c subunit
VSGAVTSGAGRGRVPRLLLGGGAAALAIAPLAWGVTDLLERDDDFCNACHLASGRPLHEAVRQDYDAAPPASLAAVHGGAAVERAGGPLRDFRCIDCHGGTGLVGRARVKLLAAKDAAVYLSGHFDEPEGMAWPLLDADCRKCHARFDEAEAEAWRSPRFHQLAVHNADLGVGCVECHLVHDADVDPTRHFLRASHVRSECARCHAEFEAPEEG